MTEIDLMVFDFDGTLVSSGRDLAAAVNHALAETGLPVRREEEIRGFIGDGIGTLVERALGQEHAALAPQVLEIFSAYYWEHLLDTTNLHPGVRRMLEHFRGTRKIIVTNKRKAYTLKIAKGLNIEEYFEEIVCKDSEPYAKPDERLLAPRLAEYSVDRKRTVVVGDGVNDVMLAKNTGVLSCAFLNGLTDREGLIALQPDYLCESMDELPALFQ